jgi:hypothetical protein
MILLSCDRRFVDGSTWAATSSIRSINAALLATSAESLEDVAVDW